MDINGTITNTLSHLYHQPEKEHIRKFRLNIKIKMQEKNFNFKFNQQ